MDFSAWFLLREAHQELVPQAVLQQYDAEFQRALQGVIQRTHDPALRDKFVEMLRCNVRDERTGICRTFSDIILGSLLKAGIQRQYDLEASISYVFEKLMLQTSEAGSPRATLFGSFDPNKSYTLEGNPLVARFFVWLQYAVNNIRRGKIPRLSRTEYRPGTISIGQGRAKKGEPFVGVSPERIAARPSADADLNELIEDITGLLRRKELAYPLPLTALFDAIVSGRMNRDQQIARWGERAVRIGRQVILEVIRTYARATDNYRLLRLLDLFKDFQANKPTPARRTLQKPTRRQLTDDQRDFASILDVLDRLGRAAGSADFGRFRRRWLERGPRDPNSDARNRLEEVLGKMVSSGVLRAVKTAKGATLFEPTAAAEQYRQAVVT